MHSAIDPFYTYQKFISSKNSSKFNGEIYWALKKEIFSYTIAKIGLCDDDNDTEDFLMVLFFKLNNGRNFLIQFQLLP